LPQKLKIVYYVEPDAAALAARAAQYLVEHAERAVAAMRPRSSFWWAAKIRPRF
jgi:uncharacterized protein involved in tolerance to divalent cations